MNPEISRQRADDVQRMKENLSRSANLRNLALEDLEQQKALVNGIKKVSQSDLIDQAQQLEHKILPAILQKANGDTENENYKYWRGVLDSLNWALHVIDYSIRLEERCLRYRHTQQYYKTLAAKLEGELAQYTTMERFLTADLMTQFLKEG
jgi:hypothetical protein